jgi:TRAP-type C4-dicarboxylate transport system permease small subunit
MTPERAPAGSSVWRLIDNLEEIVSGAALVIVVASASWGVFTRYLTRTPATWAGELATLAFAWVVFVGASVCFKRGGHVSIDMLVNFLPRVLRARLQAAIDVVVLVFCVSVAVLATRFSIQSWDHPTSVLRVPVSVNYLAVAVGFGMMAIRHAGIGWRRWIDRPEREA